MNRDWLSDYTNDEMSDDKLSVGRPLRGLLPEQGCEHALLLLYPAA
jgi:hypothetical protein